MAITTNGGAGVTADAVATLSNKTLEAPVINNATFTGQQAGLQIAFNDSIVFEGTTADANELTLTAGEPSADRTVTLPNATTTLVGTDTSDTLSNKTLTAPKFATAGEIDDANGAELIKFPATVASAVNEITISNAATGNKPTITASGDDTNITLNLVAKGSGTVQAGGVDVVTTSGSQTLTNKTLTSPVISSITNTGTITLPTSTGTLALTSGVINNTLTTTTGDMIYASSANTPARLAIGSTGQVLTVAGGIPTWAAASSGVSANDQAFAFAVQVFA